MATVGQELGRLRRSRLAMLAVVLTCYLSAPNVTNTDAYLSLPTAVSIVHSQDLDLDEFRSPQITDHYGYIALHGRHYDNFPWAVALLFVPAVLVVDVLGHLGIGGGATAMVESNSMGPVQLVTAALVSALAALVVSVVAYERLAGSQQARRRASLGVGIVFALGTAAWSTTSRALWQHGPSMLAVALALLVASRLSRRHRPLTAAALGAAAAAGYALRPTNAIMVAAATVMVVLRHRRLFPAYLGGLAAVLGPFALVNVVSYGRILPPYFSAGRISLHPDYLTAFAANLFSPARGLVLFCPAVALTVAGVVLQLRRRHLQPVELWATVCVVAHLAVVSAQNEGWWAGHAFGPRFMSDVLPLLAYLALPALDELLAAFRVAQPSTLARAGAVATAATVVWGIAVNAEGAVLRASTCWNVAPVNVDRQPDRVWDMHDPQFLAGYRAVAQMGFRAAISGPCPNRDTVPVRPAGAR